ncbi:MAG: DUF1217 domain-containing protein [Hyphomonadaceae bacterium]
MTSLMPLSTISMLFGSSSSTNTLTSLATGTSSSGTATADVGTIKTALVNAEKSEAKQLKQVAKDPEVVRDLARYAKVVKNAKTIDDVLNDPIARKVLMTAGGVGADVDNVGLAKKAMLSDPTDKSSVAYKMSSINGGWLQFAKDFDLATYGLDRLSPQTNGVSGRWKVAFEREGESIDAMLEITKVRGGYQATVDGTAVPITVNGNDVTIDTLWRDDADELHTMRLTGTLGKDGFTGNQYDDGVIQAGGWTAAPYFKDALADVSNAYIAEKRLDMLDAQLPGLGSAVLFKQSASGFKDALDILGSPLAREVVTTAFNIPKQIAVQSIEAQVKAINQRMNPAKLQTSSFVDTIAQRYLIMLNGGLGGVTA